MPSDIARTNAFLRDIRPHPTILVVKREIRYHHGADKRNYAGYMEDANEAVVLSDFFRTPLRGATTRIAAFVNHPVKTAIPHAELARPYVLDHSWAGCLFPSARGHKKALVIWDGSKEWYTERWEKEGYEKRVNRLNGLMRRLVNEAGARTGIWYGGPAQAVQRDCRSETERWISRVSNLGQAFFEQEVKTPRYTLLPR